MVRDDFLPFGFGTKWRKVFGIVQFLQRNQMEKVLLWGAMHGNYLASFTTIFRFFGFQVETITYTKDPKLKTYNERLVKLHSHSNHCYANRKEAEQIFLEKTKDFEGLCLPEFGIHPAQVIGLRPFWKQLESEIHKILKATHVGLKGNGRPNYVNKCHAKVATLVLEIGSGASFLSAFDYFYDSSILVFGVMVGERKSTWIPKIETLQKKLNLKIQVIPKDNIIEFKEIALQNSNQTKVKDTNQRFETHKGVRFAKTTNENKTWIQLFYEKTNIILEPIYSSKTIFHLLQNANIGSKITSPQQTQINQDMPFLFHNLPLFYLHQGGQIQHLDLVLKSPIE